MYVLARREGDSITIADIIEVKVLSVNGKIVRLGVSAPRAIDVKRTEQQESCDGPKRNSGGGEP